MAGEAKRTLGTEVVMESAGSSISDGGFATCADATFETAQVAGYPMGRFEMDIPGFSAAPTAGAIVNIYERKFNSDGNAAPEPDANYKNDYIGSFTIDVADAAQYPSTDCPINHYGADYYLEWIDGGAGTASIDANWVLRVIPWTYYPGT